MMRSEIIINRNYGGLNPVQFGEENCSPGHAFGPAVRTHWLLHYVVSGFGKFERESRTYRLGPGDIFVIPPMLETYYQADSKNPWHYIWIGFTTQEEMSDVLQSPIIHYPGAGVVFEDMRRCRKMENGKSAFLSGKIWELMSIFMEQGRPEIGYVEKAIHYIRSEYMKNITVQQIAERLNIDRSYFSTLFKEETGFSPQQYLIHLRLNKAATLMSEHRKSPSIAAVSVGYSDICQFSKIFKKYFGLSPRDYCERVQENEKNKDNISIS